MQETFHRLSLVVLALCGLACLVVSFAWAGCASGAGSAGNYQPSPPPAYWSGSVRRAAPKNTHFKENVLFLKEANVSTAEVYQTFGTADWESKELRLIAYLAQNKQALFVTYGSNNLVAKYVVKKVLAADSLAEAATTWQRSN